jgi:D-alanine-D-alanine ligase
MVKTVAVIFGGVSPEHDISIITAISSVIRPLEMTGKYNVLPIYISKKGNWYSDQSFKKIATFQTDLKTLTDRLKPIQLIFDNGLLVKLQGLRTKAIRIDVAFPAMHGAMGEDGSLMGLLRMAGIPFVGCDMSASAIAMDKVLAKQAAEVNNILIPKYEYFFADKFKTNPQEIIDEIMKKLSFPLFVKPAHLGSSIGITRTETKTELENAIEVAAFYDNKIIIEEAVPNLIEVTLPIIGNQEITTGLLERPMVDQSDVFDFDTKYLKGGKKGSRKKYTTGSQGYSELPVKLPKGLYEKAVIVAKQVYRSIECQGIARVDMLIDSKKELVYFNEINPMPGSLYAHNWREAGVSGVQLVEKLIQDAIDSRTEQSKYSSTFSTDFLKRF